MKKLRIAYFGTPDFSARLFEQMLLDKDLDLEISLVVTQPDKKIGRKQIVTASPVKMLAEKHSIPVFTQINDEVKEKLTDVDLGFLFAYGNILPAELLKLPKCGFWNFHPSLLPAYRGPSPVATPLLNGDVETGVTIMQMDKETDHGPIIAQEKAYIFPMWRRDQLTEHLVDVGYKIFKQLLLRHIDDLSAVPLIEQDHAHATYTKRLKKEDGFVPWGILLKCNGSLMSAQLEEGRESIKTVQDVFNRFRAYYDWPGLWTKVQKDGKELRLKITKVHLEDERFVIKQVQLEGKSEQTLEQFKQGNPHLF